MKKENQNSIVWRHLKTFGRLTPLDALTLYGIFRLSARVYDLKKDGKKIKMTLIEQNDKRYALYTTR